MLRRTLPWLLLLTLTGCTEGNKPNPEPRGGDPNKPRDDPAVIEKEKGKQETAWVQARNLEKAVLTYKVKNGEYPPSLEVLAHPQPDGGAPLLKPEDIIDPWGKQYQYDPTGPNHKGEKPDIFTMALDGTKIGNWTDKK
jgi:hypothetical protein